MVKVVIPLKYSDNMAYFRDIVAHVFPVAVLFFKRECWPVLDVNRSETYKRVFQCISFVYFNHTVYSNHTRNIFKNFPRLSAIFNL